MQIKTVQNLTDQAQYVLDTIVASMKGVEAIDIEIEETEPGKQVQITASLVRARKPELTIESVARKGWCLASSGLGFFHGCEIIVRNEQGGVVIGISTFI